MPRIFPCWNEEETDALLVTEAEDIIEDHIFKAVHCEFPLKTAKTYGAYRESDGGNDLDTTTHEQFINEFLDPDNTRDVRCLITGSSGMGKTHLVKWIRLNIDPDDQNIVVNIPKTGMSLINILKRIIKELPVDQQKQYLEQIENQSSKLTSQKDKVKRLLSELEIAISNDKSIPADFEGLDKALSCVLKDPELRNVFFEDDKHSINKIINIIAIGILKMNR